MASAPPPVVFVPGGVTPVAPSYAPLLEVLDGEISPLLKDLEVYAEDEPPADYSTQLEVDALERVVGAALLDTFHLVGFSGGGAVSLDFAAQHPARLRSLAIYEPARQPGPLIVADHPEYAAGHGQLGPDEMLAAFTRLQLRPGVEPLATMALGWHRMADAVGASLVATSWAAAVAAVLAWRRGTEAVGARSGKLGRVGSRLLMTTGLIMLAAGGLGYLLAALDPLGVLLVLADRGGSPALFAVGVVIVIGASFVVLGALVYALRDVRLDPVRPDANRSGRRPPGAGAQAGSTGSTGGDAGPGPAPSDSR